MGLCVIKSSKKDFVQAKHPSKTVFFYKPNSFRNLIRCKTCLFEIWLVQNYGFEICRIVENGSKSDAFEVLDSKYDALYKNDTETDFFQKKFFFEKTTFSRTTFPRMHKKTNFDVFTVYIDQLKCSLRASFPKNLHFLKTVFSSKFNAWLKSWPNFWRYVDIQFTFWHEVFYFF